MKKANWTLPNLRKSKYILPVAAVILLIIGIFIGSRFPSSRSLHKEYGRSHEPGESGGHAAETLYTCSMHPQIQASEPGKCPICGMELIPVTHRTRPIEEGPPVLTLSQTAKRLARIETAPVERRFLQAEIRMVGKIEYDETKLRTITAWFPARIDLLYVDFTGIEVRRGDHLARVYSPELVTAQSELLTTLRFPNNTAAIEGAREKLRLWGLSAEQVKAIEERAEPSDLVEINAPIGGIVIHKNVNEGEYVDTGSALFKIADLSNVWVFLDAYERDLPWIRYGQKVVFRTEAYPGEKFEGNVVFINPTVDSKTRTIKVRVNLPNPDRKLKPGMFVRGVIFSEIAESGKAITPDLAGKWVGPMHPEIIREQPGKCDICGMDLLRAEDLGYVPAVRESPPLVVSASAVLKTGKRAVVYVELPDRDDPTYEGREIELGPRAGDAYIVVAGLEEGERVVVNGNFKIDSALQIQAKPSMMNPEAVRPPAGHDRHETETLSAPKGAAQDDRFIRERKSKDRERLDELLEAYFKIQKALASDDLDEARNRTNDISRLLGRREDGTSTSTVGYYGEEIRETLEPSLQEFRGATDLGVARSAFGAISLNLKERVERSGEAGRFDVYLMHCPMALQGAGAEWLQQYQEVENPYLGLAIHGCGSSRGKLTSAQNPIQAEL